MTAEACPHGREGWEQRYREGRAAWDLGAAPPCLGRLLAGLPARRLRVLVPGAGFGHDAVAWARAGHQVTAVDFAPSAVAGARARARETGVAMAVLEEDLFALPATLEGAFDAVWEQTCYCAVAPKRRDEYAAAMARALVPGGTLYGLFWNHGREGGPPYDVTPAQVRDVFASRFHLLSLEPVPDSVPARGNEFLAVFRRRPPS
jgi:SAM-dependent methyltransferase